MAHYSRTKDCYTITLDNGISYSIDLATGTLYGKMGKPVKNRASYMSYVNNFTEKLFEYYRFAKAGMSGINFPNRELVDRIISLPETFIDDSLKESFICAVINNYSGLTRDKERLNHCWKVFMDMIKNHKDEIKNCVYQYRSNTFEGIIDRYECFCTLKKYGLEKLFEYFFEYGRCFEKKYFSHKAYREALKHIINNKYDEAKEKIAEFFGTDDKDILRDVYGISFYTYDYSRAIRTTNGLMRDIADYIAYLGLENYKLTNLERDYEALKMQAAEEEKKRDNEFFKANQTKYDLYFEDDIFETYVPTSREELEEIGNWFNNCANAWEWHHRLSRGTYCLVVVRDKSTKSPLVCCDIENPSKDSYLRISQYLAYNNNEVKNHFKEMAVVQQLMAFRQKYTNYLLTLKGGGK